MGWKFKSLIVCLTLLVNSCVSDYELKPVELNPIFHDNSSKVWVINHQWENDKGKNKDIAPFSLGMKYILTFHSSNACYLQRMNSFGNEAGTKGTFYIDAETNELEIQFPDALWKFSIDTIEKKRIYLRTLNIKEFPYSLEIIPVPEP